MLTVMIWSTWAWYTYDPKHGDVVVRCGLLVGRGLIHPHELNTADALWLHLSALAVANISREGLHWDLVVKIIRFGIVQDLSTCKVLLVVGPHPKF